MRHSDIAYVLIRLQSHGRDFLLLHRHAKWGDWSLVGGHVEPGEEDDWLITATREAAEEMEPLKLREDFDLEPLRIRVRWGPHPSRSAFGAPTEYRAEYFVLRFLRAPDDVLRRLPAGEFRLVALDGIRDDDSVSFPVRKLLDHVGPEFDAIPKAWDGEVELQG
ncbi:MAG: NUDIX domain-containing protein [Nannocystaceae bacterium]|nr:NUDIX domain-containing protein [bacterium]